MVYRAFLLMAVALAPASTFVLPIKEKDDGILHIEDISLAGHKNLDLLEKLTQDLKNSFAVAVEDIDSEEEDKKSVEVAISVANLRRKNEDDDTNDSKDKSIPGKHNECAEGMIYLSELDICVPYNPRNTARPLPPKTKSIYDIPQGDAPYASSAVVSAPKMGITKYDKNHNCKDGEIFLSELDICVPASAASPLPPKTRVTSIYDIPQGDAPAQLVIGEDSNESNEHEEITKPGKGHECGKGEVYLSELDICAPYTQAAPLPPKRIQSIYDIPQGDAPQADSRVAGSERVPRRKKVNKGYKKVEKNHGCGKGELYLSELDICVPYNNCYPYGDTC